MFFAVRNLLCVALGTLSTTLALANAVQISGAGATFPARVYERWTQNFNQINASVKVSYAPTGSGDGVKQATARSVQFGGTDTPLNQGALAEKGLVQIPMLVNKQ